LDNIFRHLRILLDEDSVSPAVYESVHTDLNRLEAEYKTLQKEYDDAQDIICPYLVVRQYGNGMIESVVDRSMSRENSDEEYREAWLEDIETGFSEIEAEIADRDGSYFREMKKAWLEDFPQDEEETRLAQIELHDDKRFYTVLDGIGAD